MRRAATGLAAAAGFAFLVGLKWESLSPSVNTSVRLDATVGTVALTQPGTDRSKILSQAELRTAADIPARGELFVSDEAALTTARGVKIALRRQTRVGLDSLSADSSELRLVGGSVHCQVPPLGPNRDFSVVTSDARVIVHGTRFSVTSPSPQTPTCVRVESGRVEVRRAEGTVFLGAGEAWGCQTDAAEIGVQSSHASRSRPPSAVAAPAIPRAKPSPVGLSQQLAEPPPGGTLAEETQLLSTALSAERREDRASARRLYARLLAEYPNSPLTPEAKRGLARVE
jgi:hypothetical protein